MDLVVVQTSPRPNGVHYLPKTIASLERAGVLQWPHRVLSSDGQLTHRPDDWQIVEEPGPHGNRRAMWRMMNLALDMGMKRLLYLEDDISVCLNFFPYISRFEIPEDLAFVTFFDAFKKVDHPHRLIQQPCKKFLFNQALLFPRRTMEYLVTKDPMAIRKHSKPNHCADEVIAHYLDEGPCRVYGLHMPHLVQHNGLVSAVRWREIGGRVSKHYAGDDFDALSLLDGTDKGTRA